QRRRRDFGEGRLENRHASRVYLQGLRRPADYSPVGPPSRGTRGDHTLSPFVLLLRGEPRFQVELGPHVRLPTSHWRGACLHLFYLRKWWDHKLAESVQPAVDRRSRRSGRAVQPAGVREAQEDLRGYLHYRA